MAIRVVMYDQVMYLPGHVIHRWAVGMTAEVKRATSFAAPINKRMNKSKSALAKDGPRGFLKKSIRGQTRRSGARRIGMTISSKATYAAYVALGTDTIVSDSMFLPFNHMVPRGPRPSKDGMGNFHDVVSGQRPQNFFEAGLDIASRRYPSLRG